jgi:hypothetical protein
LEQPLYKPQQQQRQLGLLLFRSGSSPECVVAALQRLMWALERTKVSRQKETLDKGRVKSNQSNQNEILCSYPASGRARVCLLAGPLVPPVFVDALARMAPHHGHFARARVCWIQSGSAKSIQQAFLYPALRACRGSTKETALEASTGLSA